MKVTLCDIIGHKRFKGSSPPQYCERCYNNERSVTPYEMDWLYGFRPPWWYFFLPYQSWLIVKYLFRELKMSLDKRRNA